MLPIDLLLIFLPWWSQIFEKNIGGPKLGFFAIFSSVIK